jgi:hypothetical protein
LEIFRILFVSEVPPYFSEVPPPKSQIGNEFHALMERENPKLEENMKEFLTIYVRYTTL